MRCQIDPLSYVVLTNWGCGYLTPQHWPFFEFGVLVKIQFGVIHVWELPALAIVVVRIKHSLNFLRFFPQAFFVVA